MQTSDKGIAYLESREGVVLKAYRDAVGVLTIGAGLTKASGVIAPKPGMVISREEARRLLVLALGRNYEPAVAKAMPGARHYAFDGGVSFHYNTGAIGRASWVSAWRSRASAATVASANANIRARLGQWSKGGGRVLPGLKRRRAEEADIILHDKWPADLKVVDAPQADNNRYAVLVVSIAAGEIKAIREGFRSLGYEPGDDSVRILRQPVEAFQKHYDLTVDGKIGRATLATLQRELDARKAATQGGAVVVGGGGGAATGEAIAPDPTAGPDVSSLSSDLVFWAGVGAAALAVLYLAYLAWHYRDLVAARVQGTAPRLAAWLRRI